MERKKWYERKGLVIFLIIFLFPVGLYGLLRSKSFKGFTKIIVLLFFIGMFLLAIFSEDETTNEDAKIIVENSSYEIVGPINDFSYSNIKRISINIVIPEGRSPQEVENTLKLAVKDISEDHEFDALSVNCFSDKDEVKDGMYTVGTAIYSSNGKWEDAGKDSKKELSIVLGAIYFSDKDSDFTVGDIISATSNDENYIALSNERDAWEAGNISAKIPTGTKGEILEVYSEKLSADYLFVRIKVNFDEKIGWVHEYDIK